jgi:NAD(P)H-dependent flavin oxidoreductase YrpB (nitropropane dioxygenase family)
LAAGGVADGRGLAAALLLGADGVVIGSRFLATQESNTHPNLKQRLTEASSSSSSSETSSSLTTKTQTIDVLRGYNWPSQYDARILSSAVIQQATLLGSTSSSPAASPSSSYSSSSPPPSASSATSLSELLEYYKSSMEKFNYSYDGGAVLFVGQCLPLLHQIESVDKVFNHIVSDAAKLLSCAPSFLQ